MARFSIHKQPNCKFVFIYRPKHVIDITIFQFDQIIQINCFLDLRRISKNVQTRNDNGSTKRWNESEAWSIVLIGVTGAGKSYFANALLGSTKPNRPDTKIQFDPDSPHASEMTCFYAQENVESVTSKGKFKRNYMISINDL